MGNYRTLTVEFASLVVAGTRAALATFLQWICGQLNLLLFALAQVIRGKSLTMLAQVSRDLVKHCFMARCLSFFTPSHLLNIALRQVGFRTRLHLSQGSFPEPVQNVSQPAILGFVLLKLGTVEQSSKGANALLAT